MIVTTKNVASGTNVTNVVKNVSTDSDDNLIFEIEDTGYNIITTSTKQNIISNEETQLKFTVKNQSNNAVPNAIINIYEV